MKNYQVSIVAFATVVVINAEDEEKALEYATQKVSFGSFNLDEATIEKEITSEEDLERCIRHCDEVSRE